MDEEGIRKFYESFPQLQLSLRIMSPFIEMKGFGDDLRKLFTPLLPFASMSFDDPTMLHLLNNPEVAQNLALLDEPNVKNSFTGKLKDK